MENKKFEELLSEVLAATKEKILSANGGDTLTVLTSISYVDRNLAEYDSFAEGKTNAIFASLTVYVKGAESEEDPAYGYTMMLDLEKKDLAPMEQFESEKNEFVKDTERFIALLAESDDVAALIKKESDAAEAETLAMMEKFKSDMAKIEKAKKIGIGIAIGLGILVVILSTILK